MSNILDNAEIIEEIRSLKVNIQSVLEGLENLKSATEPIVSDGDFTGQIAESYKAFFQEVNYLAIDLLCICLNNADNASSKLELEATNVDASSIAHIDTEYLLDIKQSKLTVFENEMTYCNSDIESQISAANTLNLRSYIQNIPITSVENAIEDSYEFLEKTNNSVEELSNSDYSSALEDSLNNLSQVLGYMSDVVTINGISTYIAGDVCKEDWYTNIEKAVEDYRAQLLEELDQKLQEEYEQGEIDQDTWEMLKEYLWEYGPTTGIGMLTKALMKQVSIAIPEMIAQGTTLFMNRGLVGALVGGGEYLVTASPTFLTSLARGLVKYGTPIVYGVFEFFRLKANGQDTVEAGVKAVGHTASVMAGMAVGAKVGAIVGSAIPIPIVGTLAGMVVGGAIGMVGSMAFDWVYDNADKIVESVGNFVTDVKDTVCEVASNVAEGIGNAVSGLFNGVANMFS